MIIDLSIKLSVDDLIVAIEQLPDEVLNEVVERVTTLQQQRQSAPVATPQAPTISAADAYHAADQALFGMIKDHGVRHESPMLIPKPKPCWLIPYRLADGTLLAIVPVDAHTGQVLLSREELARVQAQVSSL